MEIFCVAVRDQSSDRIIKLTKLNRVCSPPFCHIVRSGDKRIVVATSVSSAHNNNKLSQKRKQNVLANVCIALKAIHMNFFRHIADDHAEFRKINE